MSWKRKILAVVFPPFAVVDKGCGTYLIAFFLTCMCWIPGVIYAFAYLWWEKRMQGRKDSKNGNQAGKQQNYQANANNRSVRSNAVSRQQPRGQRRSNNNQSQGWQGW